MPSENSNTQYLVTKGELDRIADAIRSKGNISKKLKWPGEMADAINELDGNFNFDFTNNGTINISPDKVLENTFFYNLSGGLGSGTIPVQQSESIKLTSTLTPNNINNDGTIIESKEFNEGYYAGSHTYSFQIATSSQSSIISISPSEMSQTISLFGTNPTYDYFPNAITIEALPSEENKITIQKLFDKTISTAIDSSLTTIGSYGFWICSSLTTASFPSCIEIGQSAFANCLHLNQISFPECQTIGSSAFVGCYALSEVNFPKCTTMNPGAFSACRSLTTISFSLLSSIAQQAFSSCSNLTTIDLPACTFIGSSAFMLCSSLSEINFSLCSTVGSGAFSGCIQLKTASFSSYVRFSSYAFMKCTRLSSLYLYASSVVSLVASNAFSSTPIGGYSANNNSSYGIIYVPASLIDAYKTATNWKYFSSRFSTIEGT